MTNLLEDIAGEALKQYPPSMLREGYDEDYFVDDEYGYDETARNAFIAGAKWALKEAAEFIEHPVHPGLDSYTLDEVGYVLRHLAKAER